MQHLIYTIIAVVSSLITYFVFIPLKLKAVKQKALEEYEEERRKKLKDLYDEALKFKKMPEFRILKSTTYGGKDTYKIQQLGHEKGEEVWEDSGWMQEFRGEFIYSNYTSYEGAKEALNRLEDSYTKKKEVVLHRKRNDNNS